MENNQTYTSLDDLPITFSPNELTKILGISRNKAYELARNPSFPKLKLGSRIIISKSHFLEWLNNQIF